MKTSTTKQLARRSAAPFAFALAFAAACAQAGNFKWTGAKDDYWKTSGNWNPTGETGGRTLPTNDDMVFNRDNFNSRFTGTVLFNGAVSNAYRAYINNCGTAAAPLVFRATNPSYGCQFSSSKQAYVAYGPNPVYLRFESGTWSTGSSSDLDIGYGSSAEVTLTDGAAFSVGKDIVLRQGKIVVENGTLKVPVGNWIKIGRKATASLELRTGGTCIAKHIDGEAKGGTVLFDGGTLKANAAYLDENGAVLYGGMIEDNSLLSVEVGEKGGTIDTGGFNVTFARPIDAADGASDGGMKFCGGGSIALTGEIGWYGGTTIEAGTTVKISNSAQKNAILGSGRKPLKVIPAKCGEFALVTITGDATFSTGDELNASVVPGSLGSAAFSISSDRKSLMVSVTGYAGEEINQSSATLVFPGATLADLATHTLRARLQGEYIDDDGVEATFFRRGETLDGDVLTKVTYQLQVVDGGYAKGVYVDFTEDAAGVYAKLADGNYRTYDALNAFGTELAGNPAGDLKYIPYDFRMVEPANAISVNFCYSAGEFDTSSAERFGAGDYAVPRTSWNNMTVSRGSSATFGGATFTQTTTSGRFYCNLLNAAGDVRYGYLDDGNGTVAIDVADIPYEFYRVVVYHASDSANASFGYATVNGIDYTGLPDATIVGNARWGTANSGARYGAKGLHEGVNYLVSGVLTGSSATIVGHRMSNPTARGGIAAVQIVELDNGDVYTAAVDDGGAKTFSGLSWNMPLPSSPDGDSVIVVDINEDTTLDIDVALDVQILKFNVADGKILTLSGGSASAQIIVGSGGGTIAVANAAQLAGTAAGDCTFVYSGSAPSGMNFAAYGWSGVLWLKNGTMNGLLAQNLAGADSTLRLTGVTGYFNNSDSEMTSEGTLELVDDGATAAFTVSDGYSSNGKTVFAALKGDGRFAAATATRQRYIFKDASAFAGTFDIQTGNNTRVIIGNGTALNPANGTIAVAAGATAAIADGKTWTAQGGMILDGSLDIGDGATAPKIAGGAGAIAVQAGTGTVDGVDAAATPSLATLEEATLAITDPYLSQLTIGAIQNQGTIDLTQTALEEATFKLAAGETSVDTGTILYPATFAKLIVAPADALLRSFAGFAAPSSLPSGVAYCVLATETREEYGKGLFEVTDCPEGATVRVASADGTFADYAPVDGTVSLRSDPRISGAATAFDYTYTNVVNSAYQAPGLSITAHADTTVTFNNENADKTTGAYIKHHPYLKNVGSLLTLENFTIVLAGVMSPAHNTQFFHMGASTGTNSGLLITTTENDNEVLIAKNTGSTVDAANGVRASVPNSATARHAYIIRKTGTVFEVWVDGVKRGQFDGGEGFALSSSGGMQVGSDHGGQINKAGVYTAVANTDDQTGCVNVLRMFDYAISDGQAEAVWAEYPYVSQGGLYTRTVGASGTFSEGAAWQKDGSAIAFDVPVGATVDEVFYNPSAMLDAEEAAEIVVNENVAIDTFTVGGRMPLRFSSDGVHTVSVEGAAFINSPVTNEYGALYLAGAPLQLGSSGMLVFDCSAADFSDVYVTTRFQLTGLVDRNDEKVTAVLPSGDGKSYALVYNTSGSCYDLVVTPVHGVWVGTDGDFDTASNWRDGIVPAAGEEVNFCEASGNIAISVTGASAGKKLGAARMGAGVVTFTGDIAFSDISDTSKIAVGANSTVTLDGDLVFSGGEAKANNYIVYTVAKGGKFTVTGDIVADTDFLGFVHHSYTAGGGAVQARGVANNATSNSDAWAFRISANDGTATANWIVGDHGLFGSKGLWTIGSRPISLRPLDSDVDIFASVGINSTCEFNTTDMEGNARTITLGDGSASYFWRGGGMTVTGAGTLLVNYNYAEHQSGNTTHPISVSAGATLAINAGMCPSTGAISVEAGAVLEAASSGSAGIGGNLSLGDGAVLKFNFTSNTEPPVLAVAGSAAVTAAGPVVVDLSAAGGIRPQGGRYALTSGGKFTGAEVALREGAPTWVDSVEVDVAGNIVVTVKSNGFKLRIH